MDIAEDCGPGYNDTTDQRHNDPADKPPMSIERAERDLAALQQTIRRAEATLAEARERALKLEHYIEVSQEYEGNKAPAPTVADKSEPSCPNGLHPKAPKGGVSGRAVRECVTILREQRQRLPTDRLLEMLQDRGIQIGGNKPLNSLSGYLSRTPEIDSDRSGGGWGLKEWQPSVNEELGL